MIEAYPDLEDSHWAHPEETALSEKIVEMKK